jgi:copper chaperone CopZ
MKLTKSIAFTLIAFLGGLTLNNRAFADVVKVSVNGMVCGFCAQGITKKLNNTQSVENVKVDLENKLVTFNTLAGKTLDDASLSKLLMDAGYTVVKIEREKK